MEENYKKPEQGDFDKPNLRFEIFIAKPLTLS
jgi:hypothetical protein